MKGRLPADYEVQLGREIVAIFNEVFGTSATFEHNYDRVIERIWQKPDLSAADHRRIIEAVWKGEHWWAKSGAPSLNVIYGSGRQFEQAIDTAAFGQRRAASASKYDKGMEVVKV